MEVGFWWLGDLTMSVAAEAIEPLGPDLPIDVFALSPGHLGANDYSSNPVRDHRARSPIWAQIQRVAMCRGDGSGVTALALLIRFFFFFLGRVKSEGVVIFCCCCLTCD